MTSSMREKWKANLKVRLEALEKRGVTQRWVAEQLGIATQQISHWRLGQIPRLETVERLAHLIGVEDPSQLFSEPPELQQLLDREAG